MFQQCGLGAPLGGKITFGDIDLEVEIGGHYLTIEGIRTGRWPKLGQRIAMNARARDGRVVLVIEGDPPVGIYRMGRWPLDRTQMVRAGVLEFHSFCAAWARWARSQPRPAARPSAFGYWPGPVRNLTEGMGHQGVPFGIRQEEAG